MKILVGPTRSQVGCDPLDFSYTTPGEVLLTSLCCESGTWDDRCGCRRAFVGAESRQGSTVGVVAERSRALVLEAVRASAGKAWGGRDAGVDAEVEATLQLFENLQSYPAGQRLRVRFVGPDQDMELHPVPEDGGVRHVGRATPGRRS